MSRKKRRRLQKAINHTNKQTMRLRQLGIKDLTEESRQIWAGLLTLATEQGVKVKEGGMPR